MAKKERSGLPDVFSLSDSFHQVNRAGQPGGKWVDPAVGVDIAPYADRLRWHSPVAKVSLTAFVPL